MGDSVNLTRKRLIVLLRYLYNMTDEDHPVSTPDLMEMLTENGIPTNRKTLMTDLEFLSDENSPYDIIEVRGKPNRYFWGSRTFEKSELNLLIDAVSSAKFITEKKSRKLIEKLESFVSVSQREELARRYAQNATVKAANEYIYYNIDIIQTAISQEHMIEFQYYEYNARKEQVLRGNGEVYRLSPYETFWNDGFYYVIGWSDKHQNISSFRIDRMKQVQELKEKSAQKPADWDGDEYNRKIFEMFRGKEAKVTLRCQNSLMKYVIDRFGKEVTTTIVDEGHFLAIVDVSLSPNFYSWIFRFNGGIRIVAPTSVKEDYRAMIERTLEEGF